MAEQKAIPTTTRHNQALATDPHRSAWVTANAGSGKTYVLSRRVIRLMLDGVAPAQILCLTFTKAAAAEMSNRIFETLSEWAGLDETKLSHELNNLLGRKPDKAEQARARTLFALALDTPGGLKIQTIHAFCEALLHQFPLEANMSGHFQVIEADVQNDLMEMARQQVFATMETGNENPLQNAFEVLLHSSSDSAIEKALGELIEDRNEFQKWIDGDPELAVERLWQTFALRPGTSRKEILKTGLSQSAFDQIKLSDAAETARNAGGTSNLRFAAALDSGPDLEDMFAKRADCLLTQKLAPRASAVTKPVLQQHPELAGIIEYETDLTIEICENLKALHLLNASLALFTVGNVILATYQRLKNLRGLADFNDLIQAAAKLLTRSDIQQWVRYKLDKGIDHVLVDEAQDTSPEQWAIINALTEEFHTGIVSGGRARSVFVVGDEKQSIYSFQGADPREFAEQALTLEKKSLDVKQPFSPVRLDLSFRSAPDILDAVDKVFSIGDNFRGLSRIEEQTLHESIYQNEPGEVQIWPLYGKQKAEEQSSWLDPVDATENDDPAILLAQRIAQTIRQWLDDGEWLAVKQQNIQCGDILILVRRRDRFTRAVLRELKRFGLAVAGADRLSLTEHIATEDLMALGRFVVMRDDDLSLAGVLKSPLFGFDDDLLTEIAAQRGQASLFAQMELLAGAGESEFSSRLCRTVEKLKMLEALARRVRPYEFYAHLLGREGGRRAFVTHLGREAEEVLDAFLQAALDHERSGGRGLEDFLAALENSAPEIKREVDMSTDEIRVITVHSAKGLEAPVVFLVDPCSPAFIPAHRPGVMKIDDQQGRPAYLWVPESKYDVAQTRAQLEEIQSRADEEYRRLLYVAMTRAADRLIVCGWHGVKPIKHDHWHGMISRALEEDAQSVNAGTEKEYLVWHSPGRDTARETSHALGETEKLLAGKQMKLPDWLAIDARFEAPPSPSLAPSQLGTAEHDAGKSSIPSHDETNAADMDRNALEKGSVIHSLLEILPRVDDDKRLDFAQDWLRQNLKDIGFQNLQSIADSLCSILKNHQLAHLFGPDSQGETTISGYVEVAGKSTRISGRIDRIATSADKVTIADYKTNHRPPRTIEEIPNSYLVQLALYRQLILQIQPDKSIECMLIWTEDGSVTVLGDSVLDSTLATITRD